ncbi:MAG: ROK family protein [Acidimicrobiia bacterium]
MTLFGAVEIGGTKTDVAIGTSSEDLTEPYRIATGTPEETLGAVIEYLSGQPVDAVGVACFGPLDLDPSSAGYGRMLSTPKPGWSEVDVLGMLASGLSAHVSLDTDVNGAALGEGRWGAATGMSDFAYVTVGTGIGAGLVVGGRLVGGAAHPEMGHLVVKHVRGDTFSGSCPYHGDCLEGMASGPALEARFGPPDTWAGNDVVLHLAAGYVAQGMRDLAYTMAPERIIVGGGVSKLPGFHGRLRRQTGSLLGDYPRAPDLDLLISKPGLGDLSGLAGALVLAGTAA